MRVDMVELEFEFDDGVLVTIAVAGAVGGTLVVVVLLLGGEAAMVGLVN